jgi:peptidyl-prolyl cis-trans isomerase C
VVVPEKLVEIAARDTRIDSRPGVALAEDRVLSGATVRALRKRVGVPSAVSDDEVRAYFDANRARFEAPERYQIWRILCATRDEAQTVLAAAKADPSPKTFTDLARDHSQDKATNLRGGDVGFVTEDGASNEPGVRVDPAIVKAARSVADGALVPQPVSEGDYFAVVWRRGTIAARKRTVTDAAAQIRDTIARARVKDETDKLVAQLRAAHVRDEHAELLDQLEPASAPPAR